MSGKRSNEKGARFERSVCSKLSMWVSNLTREDIYWRAAMSGGRATLRAKRGRGPKFIAQTGDISAIDPLGTLLLSKFVIECKWYHDFRLDRMFFNPKAQGCRAMEFWWEVQQQAEGINRSPMLFFKQDHRGESLLVDSEGLEWLSPGFSEDFFPMVHLPQQDAYCMPLVYLLLEVDFNRIREAHENKKPRRERL